MTSIFDEIQALPEYQSMDPAMQEEVLRIGGDILAEQAPQDAESIYEDTVNRVSNLRLQPIYQQQQARSELAVPPAVDDESILRPVLAPEAGLEEELDGFDPDAFSLDLPREAPAVSGENEFDPDLKEQFSKEQARIASSLQQKPFRAIKTPSGKVVLGRQRFALSKFSEQGYEVLLKDGSRQFVNDAFNDTKLGEVADKLYGEKLDSNALALATRRAENAEELGDLFFDGSFATLSRTERMAVLDQAAHSASEKALNAKTEEDRAKYQKLSAYANQIAGSLEKPGGNGIFDSAISQFGEMSDQEMNPVDPWGIRKPLNIAKPFMQGLESTLKSRVKDRLENAQAAFQNPSYSLVEKKGTEFERTTDEFELTQQDKDLFNSPEFVEAAQAYAAGDKEAYDKAGVFGQFLNNAPEGIQNRVVNEPEKLDQLYQDYAARAREYTKAQLEFKGAFLTTPDFSTNATQKMDKDGFFSAFKQDPVGLVNYLFWSSQLTNPELGVASALTGAGIGGSALPMVAKLAGMGTVNAAVEYQNDQATRFYETLNSSAKDAGYDIATPEGFDSALNNPAVITKAGMEARNGAMAVAFVGGVSSVAAGKIVSPMARFWAKPFPMAKFWVKRGATNPRIASMLTQTGEMGFEMATESLGELGGQVFAGQEINGDEIMAEAFAGHYSGFFNAINAATNPDSGIQAQINQVQMEEKSAKQVAKAYLDQARGAEAPGEILPVNIERDGEAVGGQQRFKILRGDEPVFEGTVHQSAIDFLQTGADRLQNWMAGTYVINNEADRLVYFQDGQRKELTREGNTDFDKQAAAVRKLNDQNQMEDDAARWQDVESYQLLETAMNDQVRLSAAAKAPSEDRISTTQVRPVLDYLFQQDKALAVNLTNRFGLPIYTQDVAKFRYTTEVPPVRGLTGRPTAQVLFSDGSTRYSVGKRTEAPDRDHPFFSGYIDQEAYDRIQRFNDFDASNKRIRIGGNSIQFLYDEIATTEETKKVETEVNGNVRTKNVQVESETVREPASDDSALNVDQESQAVTTKPAKNVTVTETQTVTAKKTTGKFENFAPASIGTKAEVGKHLLALPETASEYTLNDIDLSAGTVTDVRPYTQAESRVRYSSQPGTRTLGGYTPSNRIVSLLRNANVATLFEELDHDFLQNLAPLVLTTPQLANLEKALTAYAQSPALRNQLAQGRTKVNGKLVPILAKKGTFALKDGPLYTAAAQELFGYMMSTYRNSTNGISTLSPGLNVILGQIQNYYRQLFANVGASPIANLSVEGRVILDRFFSTPPELRPINFDTRQLRAQADQVVLASKSDVGNLADAILNNTSYTPEPNAPIPVPEEPMQVIEIVVAQGNPETVADALNHFGRTGPGTIVKPGEIVFFPDSGLSGTMYRYTGVTTLPDGSQRRTFEGAGRFGETMEEINNDSLYGPEQLTDDIRAGLDSETAWAFTEESLADMRRWRELHQAEVQQATTETVPDQVTEPVEAIEALSEEAIVVSSLTEDGLGTPQNPRGDLTDRTGNLVSLEAGDHVVIPASKELIRWNGPNDFQTWTGQGWARANYDPETMRALLDSGLARRYKQGQRGVATRTYNTATARMPKMFTRGEQGERLVTQGGYQYMVAIGSEVTDFSPEMNDPSVRLVGQIQIDGRDRPAFIATPFDADSAPVEFLSDSPERKQPVHAIWKRRQKSNQPMGPTEEAYINQFAGYDAVSDAVVQGMAQKAYNSAGGILDAARKFYGYTKLSIRDMDRTFDPTGSYRDVGLPVVVAYSVLLRNDLQSLITQIENGVIPQPENLPEIKALYNAVFLTGDSLGTNMGRALRQFPTEISAESIVDNVEESLVIGSPFYRKILNKIDDFREEYGRDKRGRGLEDAMRDYGFPINAPVVAVVRQFLSYEISADALSKPLRDALIEAGLVPSLTDTEKADLTRLTAQYLELQQTPENAPLRELLLQGLMNIQEKLKGVDITKLLFETIHKNRLLAKPSTLVANGIGPMSQIPLALLHQWAYLWNEGKKRGWANSTVESILAILAGTLNAFSPETQRGALNAAAVTMGGFRAFNNEEIERNLNISSASAAFLAGGMTQEEFSKMPGYSKYLKALGRFVAYMGTSVGGRFSATLDAYFMITGSEFAMWSKLYNEAVSAWYEAGNPGKKGEFVNGYITNALTFEVNGVSTPYAIKNYERLAEDQMAIYGDDVIRNSVALNKNERTKKRVQTMLAYAIRRSMTQSNMDTWYDSVSDFGRDTAMAQTLPKPLQIIDSFAHDILKYISFKVVSDNVGTISTPLGRARIGEGSLLAPFGLLFVTFPLRAFDKFLRFYPYTSVIYTLTTLASEDATKDKKIRTGIDSLTGIFFYTLFAQALGADEDEDTWLDQLLRVNPINPIEKVRASGAQSFSFGERNKQRVINPFSIYLVMKPKGGVRDVMQFSYVEYPQLAAIIGPATSSREYFRSRGVRGEDPESFMASQVMGLILGLGIGFEKVSPGESIKGLVDMLSTVKDTKSASRQLEATMMEFLKSYANPLSSFQREALGLYRGYENTFDPKDAQARLYANSFAEGIVNPERLSPKRTATGEIAKPRIMARFVDTQKLSDAVYWMAKNDLYPVKPPGQLAVEDLFQKKADKEWAKNTFDEVNNGMFYLLHSKEAEHDAASLWRDWVLQYSKDEDRVKKLESVVSSKDNQLYKKRGDLSKFKTLKELQQQDINDIINQARDVTAIRILAIHYTDDKEVKEWLAAIATNKQLSGYTLKNAD